MNIPNTITIIRILLAPLFFTALVYYHAGKEYYRWIAFFIFLTAVLTDALDGFLARIGNMRTELGRFLDPLADKLLLLSGYLGLLSVVDLPYRPPLWITVTIVFRDIILITGMIAIYLFSGVLRVQPNFLGKCTTAAQMATLITILLKWKVSIFLCYVAAILTIASAVVYIFRELKRLPDVNTY